MPSGLSPVKCHLSAADGGHVECHPIPLTPEMVVEKVGQRTGPDIAFRPIKTILGIQGEDDMLVYGKGTVDFVEEEWFHGFFLLSMGSLYTCNRMFRVPNIQCQNISLWPAKGIEPSG
jgi:hypothetical protein